MNDALGHDAMQNLLEDAHRIQVLRQDIADFDRWARDAEEWMWEGMNSMRKWKERKAEAEQRLAELLKEKP